MSEQGSDKGMTDTEEIFEQIMNQQKQLGIHLGGSEESELDQPPIPELFMPPMNNGYMSDTGYISDRGTMQRLYSDNEKSQRCAQLLSEFKTARGMTPVPPAAEDLTMPAMGSVGYLPVGMPPGMPPNMLPPGMMPQYYENVSSEPYNPHPNNALYNTPPFYGDIPNNYTNGTAGTGPNHAATLPNNLPSTLPNQQPPRCNSVLGDVIDEESPRPPSSLKRSNSVGGNSVYREWLV